MTRQILSPLPGTFYRRPSPDQPNFKSVGDAVAVGDVIGLIEVMKSFHEVLMEARKVKFFKSIAETDAAVTKVRIAGNRCCSSPSALASAPERLANSASPATAWISTGGEAAMNAAA